MFSHIVTAAKGLFTRNESEDNIADPAGIAAATTPKMAPSVQRASATEAIPEISQSNAAMKKSKRKANSGNAEKLEDIQAKRRKRSTLEAADSDEDESTSSINTSDPHEIEESSTENVPKKHFRFGSEEPAAPAVAAVAQVQQRNQDEDEDSDDDAPETIDNSAQLIKMKEQAKKQEKAKQLLVTPNPLYYILCSHILQRRTAQKGKAKENRRNTQATSKVFTQKFQGYRCAIFQR